MKLRKTTLDKMMPQKISKLHLFRSMSFMKKQVSCSNEQILLPNQGKTSIYVQKWLNHDKNVVPTIVTIHGAPGSSNDFRHISPLLAEKVNVINLDLPGFGKSTSSPHETPTTVTLADGIEHILCDVLVEDTQSVVILGHSFGGHLLELTEGRGGVLVFLVVLMELVVAHC